MSINHLKLMQYTTASGRVYFIEEIDFDIYVYLPVYKSGYIAIFNMPRSLSHLLKPMIEGFDADCYNNIDFKACAGDIIDETYGEQAFFQEQEFLYGGNDDEHC